MKYSDMREMRAETMALTIKKRLGKNQKARLAKLQTALEDSHQPPPTPPHPNTGERADFQGNVYAIHSGKASTMREQRRSYRFARFIEKPLRSRALRRQRKQRTGGVK